MRINLSNIKIYIFQEADMINKNDIALGNKVWFRETWTERIVYGIVEEIKNEHVLLHGQSTDNDSFIGTSRIMINNIFAAREQCIQAVKKENDLLVATYKAEITDINSLVNFPLHHSFGAEEYTDYEAIKAYKERAAELGFTINAE